MTTCISSSRALEQTAGRYLIAFLFAAGAVQKAVAPEAAQALLTNARLPEWLIWAALAFNAGAAFCLMVNLHVPTVSRALAIYCLATSLFHLIPSDPWQLSIMIKNWAIAGGFLILAAATARDKPPATRQ